MVNRIWHHLFGVGLVPTTSDFGKAGSPPSHPALLDWLAHHFMHPREESDAWSLKTLIRLIATCFSVARSITGGKELDEVIVGCGDLLPTARSDPRQYLMAADRLDTRLGGPSYRIHNIKKTYAQWEVTDMAPKPGGA